MSTTSSTNTVWFAISMGLMGVIVGYGVGMGIGPSTVANLQGQQVAQQPAAPDAPSPAVGATTDTPPTIDDDEVKGDKDAPITLIEFTDYQCPFCSRHYTQTYGSIVKDYVDAGKVKLAVRDFPLGFHPNAQKAAEATECAGEDGKFFDMHDALFTKQGEWSNLDAASASAKFKEYAKGMGLGAGFDSCLDSGDMAEEVKADLAAGSNAGIDGTPGFWILGPNGQKKKISGAYPYDTFKAAFEEMLAGK